MANESLSDLMWQLAELTKELSSTAGTPVDAVHMAVGTAEAAGEVLGMEKKAYFQGHDIDDLDFRLEVGDLLFYLLGLLRIREVPIQECVVAVLAKLRKRYPDGVFDGEKSVNRSKLVERQAAKLAIERWRANHV